MSRWQTVRIAFLATLSSGLLLALGKVAFYPSERLQSGNRGHESPTFEIPAEVSLNSWTAIDTTEVTGEGQISFGGILAGRNYTYSQGETTLSIETLHLVALDADVRAMVWGNLPVPDYAVRHRSGIGYYGLLAYRQQAYLSACINPYGGTTFTGQQFRRNRYLFDIRPRRILAWIQDDAPLQDHRCLLVHFELPLSDLSRAEAFELLESTWFEWHEWWEPRFQNSQSEQFASKTDI
ncbi:cyanoexosortase A system-associated protein [Synechococcus sp. PCC 7336]|uniref:cyanoexosortase A system-associated protein n=1 Tax=Synechococcus sp. PCC 7336 TaxID=195250 RepID=UPI0003471028|nr:cyanoexosortase A system-associated protein [Synechococcus sp. PCC 7336]